MLKIALHNILGYLHCFYAVGYLSVNKVGLRGAPEALETELFYSW